MPQLTTGQVTAVVFNETRSLSGAEVDAPRVNIAGTVMNAAGSPPATNLYADTYA